MKIIVFMFCHNQADILPWTLRHYETFADEISVFDDASTDGSREILKAHPKVLLRDYNLPNGIDEDHFLHFIYSWYPKAVGRFDWCMWVDPDEFIYDPDVRGVLADNAQYEVISTVGFNMVNLEQDGLPADDGRQLWEILQMGVRAPVYSKPIVFRPETHIRWIRGRHALEHCNPHISATPLLKLLHYRYLGPEYTRAKNAKNYARCGLINGDKGPAWSCSPAHKGEHSPEWALKVRQQAFKVV